MGAKDDSRKKGRLKVSNPYAKPFLVWFTSPRGLWGSGGGPWTLSQSRLQLRELLPEQEFEAKSGGIRALEHEGEGAGMSVKTASGR